MKISDSGGSEWTYLQVEGELRKLISISVRVLLVLFFSIISSSVAHADVCDFLTGEARRLCKTGKSVIKEQSESQKAKANTEINPSNGPSFNSEHIIPAGKYTGQYSCSGDTYNAIVEIQPSGGKYGGRFTFRNSNSTGIYIFDIMGEGELVDFVPRYWEMQPKRSSFANIRVMLSDDQLNGKVLHPACGEIHLVKAGRGSAAPIAVSDPAFKRQPSAEERAQAEAERARIEAEASARRAAEAKAAENAKLAEKKRQEDLLKSLPPVR